MVSVIVPVYKVEKYLVKCVNSILAQSFTDFELILVDDGSPDNSGKICDEFAEQDGRVKVIHQKNAGQAVARNAGISIARGEYIAFVDSDDYVTADYLKTLVSLIQKYQCDLAICGHRIVHERVEEYNCAEKDSQVQCMGNDELWDEIFGRLNNAVWNKLFKKELLQGILFPKDLGHGEDLIFNLEYILRCKTAVKTNKECYFYLKRSDSITTSSFSTRKLKEIESKDRALEIVEKAHPEQLSNAKKYCFRARMNVIRAIYKAKKDQAYSEQLKQYRVYICSNYGSVCAELRAKEIVEFYIYTKLPLLYKIIVKMI